MDHRNSAVPAGRGLGRGNAGSISAGAALSLDKRPYEGNTAARNFKVSKWKRGRVDAKVTSPFPLNRDIPDWTGGLLRTSDRLMSHQSAHLTPGYIAVVRQQQDLWMLDGRMIKFFSTRPQFLIRPHGIQAAPLIPERLRERKTEQGFGFGQVS